MYSTPTSAEKPLLSFFVAENLVVTGMAEMAPWLYRPDLDQLTRLRSMPKQERRTHLNNPSSSWNIYSAIRGVSRRLRVSKDNAPAAVRGLVVDYDAALDEDGIRRLLGGIKEPNFVPNFIERTLGGNVRLVWVFEREVLVPNTPFCEKLLETFVDKLHAETLLPGYDAHSVAPHEVWSNGGQWHAVKETAMPWQTIFGIVCHVSNTVEFGSSEIPLEVIHGEIERRWPGRWQGAFELNHTGVRFWDDQADNPTGCQVKPDGMLCFTGPIGFQKWESLFGAEWCDSKRAINLGNAAGDTYFDGRAYWQNKRGRWYQVTREDLILWLKNHRISAKLKRGQTVSDVERVLAYIQEVNRIDGAAPIVNRPPGITYLDGNRILNTSTVRALVPADKPDVTPGDFPWLWNYLTGLFDHTERGALDHWLAWMKRFYTSILECRPLMGQAVFLCGPKDNGKTLLAYRVIKPMVGDKSANPYDYFTGLTTFNGELFESPLLSINDEEAITGIQTRLRFLARIKSFVVNPSHMYHKKFCQPVNIEWTGRLFSTLNDDPSSVGLLPEVNENTRDKMMFFASLPRPKNDPWPENIVIEAIIAEELPFLARWLLDWTPPESVLIGGRMGVKSFFDPHILELSMQQNAHYYLLEVMKLWFETAWHWHPDNGDKNKVWEGDPTRFYNDLANLEGMQATMKEWSSARCANALTTLARIGNLGVEFVGQNERKFRITREAVFRARSADGPANPPTAVKGGSGQP